MIYYSLIVYMAIHWNEYNSLSLSPFVWRNLSLINIHVKCPTSNFEFNNIRNIFNIYYIVQNLSLLYYEQAPLYERITLYGVTFTSAGWTNFCLYPLDELSGLVPQKPWSPLLTRAVPRFPRPLFCYMFLDLNLLLGVKL